MIFACIGSLHVQLAYEYESYAYEGPTGMITCTLIVSGHFLRARQAYAYETETHIFTSHSDAHARNTPRIHTRMPIIHRRFMEEAYAYN